jgi:eukaryotic-like serine/threonine-protein kinase
MADIIRDGDRLYAVTLQDELICLDLSSGQLLWTFASGWVNERMINVMAAPALVGGQVFFGSRNGAVHAVDARSGRLVWKRDVGAPVVTPLIPGLGAVYFGTFDQRIHRIALSADAAHTDLALGGVPYGPPTLLGDSLVVLVYDKPDEASLTALDHALQRVRWSREVPGGWSSARPLLWRGTVWVAGEQGMLAAFSPSGSEHWSDTVGRGIRGVGAGDDALYLGAQKGTVYAYRPSITP